MRLLVVASVLALSLCLLGSGTVQADEAPRDTAVSSDTLAAMGMAGMTTVDDATGHQIRGTGCGVSVWMFNLAILRTPRPIYVDQIILVGGRTPQTAFAISRNIVYRW
jgi:hypothetical protein